MIEVLGEGWGERGLAAVCCPPATDTLALRKCMKCSHIYVLSLLLNLRAQLKDTILVVD